MNHINKSTLQPLPLPIDVESKRILRKSTSTHRALAELKGVVKTIPNAHILIQTLALQEAKDSSEIENIITTHDDLFKSDVYPDRINDLATKEVQYYSQALQLGYSLITNDGFLRNNTICSIQEELERNQAGFRKVPGTVLKNSLGETVFTPPQHPDKVISLMNNLELYINDTTLDNFDPLVKIAIIHYQFESIHPFYDGNGRTGRIINILYLVLNGLLDLPILYGSRYIVKNKSEYYRLLNQMQADSNSEQWEAWIFFMLESIERTAHQTMRIVESILKIMESVTEHIKENHTFYSHELLENLFKHPYTKVEFLQEDTGVSRATAQRHLTALVADGTLEKLSLGKANYYVNHQLYEVLLNPPTL